MAKTYHLTHATAQDVLKFLDAMDQVRHKQEEEPYTPWADEDDDTITATLHQEEGE